MASAWVCNALRLRRVGGRMRTRMLRAAASQAGSPGRIEAPNQARQALLGRAQERPILRGSGAGPARTPPPRRQDQCDPPGDPESCPRLPTNSSQLSPWPARRIPKGGAAAELGRCRTPLRSQRRSVARRPHGSRALLWGSTELWEACACASARVGRVSGESWGGVGWDGGLA